MYADRAWRPIGVSSAPVDLIIVRHGRPVRIEGADGAADPPLADVGHHQAEAVAELLLEQSVDLIVSSPMLRARQTAAPLARRMGVEPVIVDDLAEIDQHSDTYVPMEELKAQGGEAWQAVMDDPDSMHGEVDIDGFAATVCAAFDQLIADNRSRTVVAFCHGMVTMSFLQYVLGYRDRYGLRVDYASVTRVQASSNGVRSVRSVNETGHLGDHFILSP